MCPAVVKVEERDDTGGFLKTRLQKVKELCAEIPNAYWTNQYENLDAMEAHYQLTAGGRDAARSSVGDRASAISQALDRASSRPCCRTPRLTTWSGYPSARRLRRAGNC